MTFTRANKTEATKHVLEVVLDKDPGGEIERALKENGFADIRGVVTLTDFDLEFDDNGTPKVISKGDRGLLDVFGRYIRYLRLNPPGPGITFDVNDIDAWKSLDQAEFDNFRTSHLAMQTYANVSPSTIHAALPGTGSTATAHGTPRPRDELAEFEKGIKRDPSQFTDFKDAKQWDKWKRDTTIEARAQRLSNVLDRAYTPSTQSEIQLFNRQQEFMSAVFNKRLQTTEGQRIVRKFLDTADAQSMYAELTDFYSKSVKAEITAQTLLKYIVSADLGPRGNWKGTTKGFVLHWLEQVRQYEDYVGSPGSFPDKMKITMLSNAVRNVPALHQVYTTAESLRTSSGTTQTYGQYIALLETAADQYDSSMTRANGANHGNKPARRVYQHDMCTTDGYDLDIDVLDLLDPHEDVDLSVLEINNVDYGTPRTGSRIPAASRMAHTQWSQLSTEEKQLWDKLSAKAKAVILNKSTDRSTPGKLAAARSRRDAQLHQLEQLITAQLHALSDDSTDPGEHEPPDTALKSGEEEPPQNSQPDDSAESQELLSFVTDRTKADVHPADVRRVLSTALSKYKINKSKRAKTKTVDTTMAMTYDVTMHDVKNAHSLVDRGANGGVAGEDVRVIDRTHRTVNIRGVGNHEISDIHIGTVGAVVPTQRGEVIAIMHQYAIFGTGKTIHSSLQLEHFGNDVNEKSVKLPNGLQRIKTPDGYVHPIDVKDGLGYVPIRPFTDKEWDELPHVIWTSDVDWDPAIYDMTISDQETWYDAVSDIQENPTKQLFDQYGDYLYRVQASKIDKPGKVIYEEFVDACACDASVERHVEHVRYLCDEGGLPVPDDIAVAEHDVKTQERDYGALQRLFGWLPTDIIKRTFKATTQYARMPTSTVMKKHYKSQYPALNVKRRDEAVATDTVFADTPAVDDGSTAAQLFVGTESMMTDVYGVKTDKEFVNTLEDNVRLRGAPTRIISDRAQAEIGKRVKDILRTLVIGWWQSEPHQHHQNPAERRYQTVKRVTNTVLERSGAPSYCWLLALMYVCFILNHTVCDAIGGKVPLQVATGSTPDISPLLRFGFYEPVYYRIDDSDFPSDTTEKLGYCVGIAEHVGHAMTYKVLTADTKKVIYRSNVRTALDDDSRNLRADILQPAEITRIIKSKSDDDPPSDKEKGSMPVIEPLDLVGRTFLLTPQEDGQRLRAKIVQAVEEQDTRLKNDKERIKFKVSVNDEIAEEIMSYQEVLDHIAHDQEDTIVWKFRKITSHEGPLTHRHPNWKGSKFNVMIEWETGEITSEPLAIIAKDDPVTCALYARDNNLLEEPGWRQFKRLAKRHKKLLRMVNQAKLKSYRHGPKYKYGYEVPRNYDHAVELDRAAGNTKWQDAVKLEMRQLDDYDTFKNWGRNVKMPPGYKKIRVHLVYDVKHDGRHKARCVAGGHLTDDPIGSVYSGVVSLRGIRLLMFLAELNGMEAWATDIGNAYLEAITAEKVYIIAGPEFGPEREGCVLVIHKALYGLKSSGQRWHDKLAACLKAEGFMPCKGETDIWMRRRGDLYEYIAVYVDDLAIVSKSPQGIIDVLLNKYKFKLKGTGPISFHLGCDFFRDDEGALCMAPVKYIKKMVDGYERMFGEKPKALYTSPLEKGDHPELDTSDMLDSDGISKYQSLIGSLQWSVSIGRLDITTAVMTLGGFRAAPRQGHLDRARRVVGYLSGMNDAKIRIRTEEPDYSAINVPRYDWAKSIYGEVIEEIPKDIPEPLGKYVQLTHYVDANLFHDKLTGRSVTGILHLVNQTPIDWYSKKQSTVETATYGSEFVAARTCVEQIIELRTTLRYLGVKIRERSYMFGDNKSVVDSSMQPHAKLHKRHTQLSFHRVREMIASGAIVFIHIDGEINPADILSKHWGFQQVKKMLKPLLFWKGDTKELIGNRKKIDGK